MKKIIIIPESNGFIPGDLLNKSIMVTSGIEQDFGPLSVPCGPVKHNLFSVTTSLPGMSDEEAIAKTKKMGRDEVLHIYFWLIRNWAECGLPTDDTQIIIGHYRRLPIYTYCVNGKFMLNSNPRGFRDKTIVLHSQD